MFAQDFVEPYDAPDPETCNCEQALEATVTRLKGELLELRAQVASLEGAERDAWNLAQEVLQSVTLEEAQLKASIYLGLAQPF